MSHRIVSDVQQVGEREGMDQQTQRRDNVRRVLAAAKAVGEKDFDGTQALLSFETDDEWFEFSVRTLNLCWALLQEVDNNVDELVVSIIEASDELLDDGW